MEYSAFEEATVPICTLAEKTDISDEELNEIAKEDLPEWVIYPQNN